MWQVSRNAKWIEGFVQDHRCTAGNRGVRGNVQAMGVEQRQYVQQGVISGEPPGIHQGRGTERQIGVAQHGTFGPACRAAGVQHAGRVLWCPWHVSECPR